MSKITLDEVYIQGPDGEEFQLVVHTPDPDDGTFDAFLPEGCEVLTLSPEWWVRICPKMVENEELPVITDDMEFKAADKYAHLKPDEVDAILLYCCTDEEWSIVQMSADQKPTPESVNYALQLFIKYGLWEIVDSSEAEG